MIAHNYFRFIYLAVIAGALGTGSVGCGASAPAAQTPESAPQTEVSATTTAPPEPAANESPVSPPPAPSPAAPPPASSPAADDYTISALDCQALGKAYHRAWLRDARKKLAKQKLNDKLRPQAERNISRAAEEGKEQWLSQCLGIAGSPFIRRNLVCANKARSIQRFNDCWDGKVKSP